MASGNFSKTRKSMQRKRRNVSKAIPSQVAITRRIRAVFADGYTLLPDPVTITHVNRLREALRELARDNGYWTDLLAIQMLKGKIRVLVEQMKGKR